jgi:hypothetical protein
VRFGTALTLALATVAAAALAALRRERRGTSTWATVEEPFDVVDDLTYDDACSSHGYVPGLATETS